MPELQALEDIAREVGREWGARILNPSPTLDTQALQRGVGYLYDRAERPRVPNLTILDSPLACQMVAQGPGRWANVLGTYTDFEVPEYPESAYTVLHLDSILETVVDRVWESIRCAPLVSVPRQTYYEPPAWQPPPWDATGNRPGQGRWCVTGERGLSGYDILRSMGGYDQAWVSLSQFIMSTFPDLSEVQAGSIQRALAPLGPSWNSWPQREQGGATNAMWVCKMDDGRSTRRVSGSDTSFVGLGSAYVGRTIAAAEVLLRAGLLEDELVSVCVDLVKAGAWDCLFLEDSALVCRRPTRLHHDEQGRLHHATGPAVEWADGYGSFFVHGRAVARNQVS